MVCLNVISIFQCHLKTSIWYTICIVRLYTISILTLSPSHYIPIINAMSLMQHWSCLSREKGDASQVTKTSKPSHLTTTPQTEPCSFKPSTLLLINAHTGWKHD